MRVNLEELVGRAAVTARDDLGQSERVTGTAKRDTPKSDAYVVRC